MGRAFEFRRARKEKRWGKMAVAFTKLSKEITLAAKRGGADPSANLRLKVAIDSARAENMPKDKIEAAIRRATSKEAAIEEITYEGYGPHGVAIVVEAATDNPTRTVGNLRSYFTHAGGSLGTTGSVDFLFERVGLIEFESAGAPLDELELELIDHGATEFSAEGEIVAVTTEIADFSGMQQVLEKKNHKIRNASLQRLPISPVEMSGEKLNEVTELIEKLEEDEDVQAVYHTLK